MRAGPAVSRKSAPQFPHLSNQILCFRIVCFVLFLVLGNSFVLSGLIGTKTNCYLLLHAKSLRMIKFLNLEPIRHCLAIRIICKNTLSVDKF